ncbi:MAG: PAS domain S-box protein, partial [Nitrospira sp.]|nr:PAS domain S-box protein [Nitrospira sp.]
VWAGAYALRRTIGLHARFETIREISGYAVLAPFMCVISATISLYGLRIFGTIQPDQVLFMWGTWWVGDTLGVLSFFPMTMALIGTPASAWTGRRRVVVSAVSVILVLVVSIYIYLSQWEFDKTKKEFHFEAAKFAEEVQYKLQGQEYVLEQLDAALSLSQTEVISREMFGVLAQPSLNRFPMLQAIEWAPEVPVSRRERFESSQQQSYAGFVITQRNAAGELEPVSHRPLYYPVTYAEPVKGNEKAIGFDLISNSVRKAALLEAMRTDSPIATEPLKLVQEQGSQSGIVLLRRVRGGVHAPGVVLTVLRVGDFIEKISVLGESAGVIITDTQLDQVIYGTRSTVPSVMEFSRLLQFGGRSYELRVLPSAGFLATHRSVQSWGFLVVGVLGSGLLGAFLLLITGTTNHVQAQVDARTQELSLQNKILQAVINNVPVCIYWKDRALTYLGCNRPFACDAGKDAPSELVGKDDFQMSWAQEAEGIRNDDRAVMVSGVSQINSERSYISSTGRTIWLRISRVPLKNHADEVMGLLGIYEDITEDRAVHMQLRDSEERFRRLFNSSPDPVWIIEGHHFVECNQAAVDMLGYPDKASLHHTPSSALSPEYQPDGELSFSKAERMMQIAQDQGVHRFEWVYRRKNKTDFYAEVTLSSLTLQGRSVMYCEWRDITERKQVEEGLRKSEQALNEAQQLAKMGSWELDLVKNQLSWSDETYRIFEIDQTRFKGSYEAFLNGIHPDDRDMVNKAYTDSLETREPYCIRHRLRMADGRIKHVLERCRTDFDEAGNPLRSIGTVQDVTEQVLYDQALQLSEERFDLAMQAANDGLWDWDISSSVVYFSPRWKAMLGYADYELDDTFITWERLIDDEGRRRVKLLISDCVTGKSDGFSAEFRMRHKEERWVDILSHAIVVRDGSGRAIRMVGTHADITERKAAEARLNAAHKQALAATEAKSNFLTSMSHEIRTPLNMINGMAEILLGTSLSEEQTNYVRRFSRAANHLLELINDILDLSKIEADRLGLEAIPFNPADIIATVRDLMEVSAHAKQVELAVHVTQGLPSLVIGDPTRLRQVLMNLIGNAIKFTEHGSVAIRVEAAGPDRVRFEVSDTGIGIPEEKLGEVFGKFTQVDSTIRRRFGGTGLGLAISKRLVELMQGEITVRSTVGVGSTFVFTIRLPSADSVVSERGASAYVDRKAPCSDQQARILLVDDLEDNRDLVALFLKDMPYTIDMAENGAVAVEKFQQSAYDLVFMDMQMPVMDGLQATTAIREWERNQGRVPTALVALTAHALKEERDKSLAAGCNAHLTKPIKKQELLKAIADYVHLSSADQAA